MFIWICLSSIYLRPMSLYFELKLWRPRLCCAVIGFTSRLGCCLYKSYIRRRSARLISPLAELCRVASRSYSMIWYLLLSSAKVASSMRLMNWCSLARDWFPLETSVVLYFFNEASLKSCAPTVTMLESLPVSSFVLVSDF